MSLAQPFENRNRATAAAIAAIGVAIVLFGQDLIGIASSALIGFPLNGVAGGFVGILWQLLGYGFVILLMFALGVFVSLWLLAPASSSLTATRVVLRGLLASAIGAAMVLVVSFAFGMIGPMSGAGPIIGFSFPWPELHGSAQAATMAFHAAIGAFVRQAPIVVLVVILSWLWAQKHKSPTGVSGAITEV